MNYLGLDWGEAKIGLAIGSDELNIASPFGVVKVEEVVEVIKQIIKEENIEAIVLGQPKHMSGDESTPDSLVKFKVELETFGLPVHMQDERLTTFMANNLVRETGKRTKRAEDDVAASIILQDFFNQQRGAS